MIAWILIVLCVLVLAAIFSLGRGDFPGWLIFLATFYWLCYATVIVGIGYVIFHFASKYW